MNKEIRDIRLVFALLSIIAGAFAYKIFPSVISYILFFADTLLWLFILAFPLRLRPLFEVWIKATRIIGTFNTQILLSLIFFLIIFPIGVIMRMAGKDPMNRKKKNTGTYWRQYEIEGLRDKKRYERQF